MKNVISSYSTMLSTRNKLTIYFLEDVLYQYKQLEGILNQSSNALLLFTTYNNQKFLSLLKLPTCIHIASLELSVDAILKITMKFMSNGCLNHQSPNRQLTVRERRIITLYVRGVSIANIAKRLDAHPKTINNQKNYAMKKIGVRTRIELFRKQNIITQCSTYGFI
ncbi:helix-turn-helix transcriptional regulator [Enterobacter sp. 120016]|uniref:helix-turn-helix domain-containing protein n=1 Tax=Enterobacter sp. 120016 TaxID=2834878 RepID=UPI001BD1BC26|nr:helix-turn-helix transcriptional regulator [Enterobacter sp. 120016]MBS7440987.1 helix-turn-helix transcriptional regulator [Enterobacter sp. 120016]